jgi:hypothetical protein
MFCCGIGGLCWQYLEMPRGGALAEYGEWSGGNTMRKWIIAAKQDKTQVGLADIGGRVQIAKKNQDCS